MFEFNGHEFDIDEVALRISIASENGKNYFLMQREEDSSELFANLENIYIERDDQGFGGFGGICRVDLSRNSLIILLSSEMALKIGGYSTIKISFSLDKSQFQDLGKVLRKIMQGYEDRLNVATA